MTAALGAAPKMVPEGLNEGSQAIHCLGSVKKEDPSQRDGMIWSIRGAPKMPTTV